MNPGGIPAISPGSRSGSDEDPGRMKDHCWLVRIDEWKRRKRMQGDAMINGCVVPGLEFRI